MIREGEGVARQFAEKTWGVSGGAKVRHRAGHQGH